MSINKESYLCLSAMLRAREPRMLTADKAARMLDASGYDEAAKIIQECGYEDMSSMNASEIDAALSAHRAAIFAELDNLVPDKALVDMFRLKYDYHNAKAIIKAEALGIEPERLLSSSGRIPPEKIRNAFDEERTGELPKALGESMAEAASILARTANPQLADIELDRAYYSELLDAAAGLDNAFITGYARLLIDSANLKSAVRTARMKKSPEFLSSVLIKGATDVDRIESADSDGLCAIFSHSVLEKAAAAGSEAMNGGSMTAFELECDNAVNAYIKGSKLVSYGPEVVVSYLAALENEITAVRMILTGALSGVPAETIRERLRDMYA